MMDAGARRLLTRRAVFGVSAGALVMVAGPSACIAGAEAAARRKPVLISAFLTGAAGNMDARDPVIAEAGRIAFANL